MAKIKLYIIVLLSIISIGIVLSQEIENPSMLVVSVYKVNNDSIYFNIINTTLSDTLYFSIFKQELINEKYTTTSPYDIFSKNMYHGMRIYRILPEACISFCAVPEAICEGSSEDEKWDGPVVVETVKYRFLLKVTINNYKEKIYKFYSNYIE